MVWLGRVDSLDLGPPAPRTGAPAPDFTLVDLEGNTHKLSEYVGQAVIINFWSVYCVPCRAEMPDLQQVYEEYQDQGLVLLAVNQNEPPNEVDGFIDDYDLTFPILYDTGFEVSRDYEIESFPTTYFVDRRGRVRHVTFTGPMSASFVESLVLDLLK